MNDRVYLIDENDPSGPPIPVKADEPLNCVLGRGVEADVVLAAPSVSRRHCRLFQRDGQLLVEDLGSRLGTMINGRPLEGPARICSGDQLGLGPICLRVEVEPADLAKTVSSAARVLGSSPPARAAIVTGRSADTPLAGQAVRIGRDPAGELRIDDLTVSRRHAVIERAEGGWRLTDLRSTNGTFLNGSRIDAPQALRSGDLVSIASHPFRFTGEALRPAHVGAGARIDMQSLGKVVSDRRTGKPPRLLKDVGMVILPGQFVGLLGSSGCGKSTLMDAINGRRRATEGRVLYDGADLAACFDAFKAGIGYVPQQLIFHEALPLVDALRYTSRLRLAGDATEQEIQANIDQVLKTVGLFERRDALIGNLSGGQKKRVSVAMELLSRPGILFLDEVTSGPDLGAEQQMMELFGSPADDGMTVVCITHYVDSLEVCDAVAYLVQGRLAYFGPPERFRKYVGIDAIRNIYSKEPQRSPEQWEQAFRESDDYAAYVGRFVNDEPPPVARPAQGAAAEPRGDWSKFKRQFGILLKRYSQVLTIDRRNILVLLGLAPVVALLISLVSHSTDDTDYGRAGRQNILCFGSMLTMMFLGLFGSVREIVKELDIYRHERFINLRILPYLLSKVVPLAAVGAMQAFVLTLIVNVLGGLDAGNFFTQFLVLWLVSLSGTAMGLAISAGAPSSDWAVMSMIAVVIPQMLFAGAILKLKGASAFIGQVFVTGYWGRTTLTAMLPDSTEQFLPSRPEFTAFAGALLLLVHIGLFTMIAATLLARKDGPGGIRRAAIAAVVALLGKRTVDEPAAQAPTGKTA